MRSRVPLEPPPAFVMSGSVDSPDVAAISFPRFLAKTSRGLIRRVWIYPTPVSGNGLIPELGLVLRPMEPIIDYLKRKLKEAGPARWDAIAHDCGVAPSLLRKIAYADRENPGVQTVQPLIDFFLAVDRGDKSLPWDGIERRTKSGDQQKTGA